MQTVAEIAIQLNAKIWMNYHKAKSTWQRKILVMGCLKFQNELSNKKYRKWTKIHNEKKAQ